MKKQGALQKTLGHPGSVEVISWEYEFGPPRRSLLWYVSVLVIGAVISMLFYTVSHGDWNATGWGILWALVVLMISLVPPRTRLVQLERDLLTIRDAKHERGKVEKNLREFAAHQVTLIETDSLNPDRYMIELLQRSGGPSIEFVLPEDPNVFAGFMERVQDVVPPAPEIAPSLIKRFLAYSERWIGWR